MKPSTISKVALLLLFGLFCTTPVVWQILTSIRPNAEIAAGATIIPRKPTLEHYQAVIMQTPWLRVLANSLCVAGAATAICLVVGSLAAFALAVLQVPGRQAVLGFVLATSMFPAIATVSPLYLLIRMLGLRDTLLALILVDSAFALPFTIWILTSFFRAVPRELYLAARVDGAGPFRVYFRIFLPLSLPALAATALLIFIFAWNEFLFALTFTASEQARTVPVAIALFSGLHEIPWGEMAAASILSIAPLLVLLLIFQRQLIQGLTAGAVKG